MTATLKTFISHRPESFIQRKKNIGNNKEHINIQSTGIYNNYNKRKNNYNREGGEGKNNNNRGG